MPEHFNLYSIQGRSGGAIDCMRAPIYRGHLRRGTWCATSS